MKSFCNDVSLAKNSVVIPKRLDNSRYRWAIGAAAIYFTYEQHPLAASSSSRLASPFTGGAADMFIEGRVTCSASPNKSSTSMLLYVWSSMVADRGSDVRSRKSSEDYSKRDRDAPDCRANAAKGIRMDSTWRRAPGITKTDGEN
jgi:hypothetical protein